MAKEEECRHFNGFQHRTCLAGVDYDAVSPSRTADGFTFTSRLPCFTLAPDPKYPQRSLPIVPCAKRSLLTPEEVVEQRRAMDEAVGKAMEALATGKCATCGANIEPSQKVGRCLYASCGHRVGQVG